MSRDLILIAFAMLVWGLGEGMFFFFQPLYLQELGADPLQIGAILGAVGLAMTLAYLPAGYLSDRIGRRPLLILAWVIGALCTGAMALSRSLPIFIASMVLYGTTSAVTVPLNSYITAARGRFSVGRALTLISAFFNLGYILGPLIGGQVGQRLGLQANFRSAALIFLVSTAIVCLVRSQPVEPLPESGNAPGVRQLWRGSYGRYVVLISFVMFGMYLPQPLAQNFLQNERGVSLAAIGQLLSVRSLGIVILNLFIGQLNSRVGYLLTQVCMGFFSLLIWLGTGFPHYLLGYLLMGSFITGRGLAIAQARALVHSANMGVAYGLLETAMASAMVLGPPLAGLLYEIQPNLIYIASLALIALGLGANLAFSPLKRHDLTLFEEREAAQLNGP